MSFVASAQTNILLITKTGEKDKIKSVNFYDIGQKETISLPFKDSLSIRFSKAGIDYYTLQYTRTNGKNELQFLWLNDGNITIKTSIDSTQLHIDTVLNAPIYYTDQELTAKRSALFHKKDTNTLNQLLLTTFKETINSPYSFTVGESFTTLNQNSEKNLLLLKALSDQQGDSFQTSPFYSLFKNRLNALLSVKTIPLDEYVFIDTSNKKVKFLQEPKDYYILDFWFLNCRPCIEDHKKIITHLSNLDKKKAAMISISIDKNFAAWKAYLIKNNYNWTNYLETPPQKLTDKLGLQGFPTYVVINPMGKILFSSHAFETTLTWLESN